MLYASTMGLYQRMREQLNMGLDQAVHQGIQWLSPDTAHHRLMGIERGTLLLLVYRCESFTPEMLELVATRQIIIVPVHCSKCSNYGAVIMDKWEKEYVEELADKEAPKEGE